MLAYSASKGAINGILMPMARDLGKFGIRSLAIAPSTFNTPMVVNALTPEDDDYMK
jgi:NAD(P)-dependent dehydrogenase (short-subunit alcohol dehydrogenase family)